MLKTRVITGAVLALVFIGIFALSYISWVLPLLAAVLSIMSLYELQRATGFLKHKGAMLLAGVGVMLLAVLPIPNLTVWMGLAFALALPVFRWLMSRVGQDSRIPDGICWLIAGMLPIFYRTMAELRGMEHGLYLLVLAILVAVTTDVGAYFAGSNFGKHKLAPALSPHKTIEGSIGGTLTTVVLLMVFSVLACGEIRWGVLMAYLVLGSAMGQFGDLSMSALKRIVGIKDYSHLLPGHGGVLDRFDSVLFILPFSYLFLRLFPLN